MTQYNKTQLNPDTTMERHVYHRDQFAHYLRWTHILKHAKIGMKILDFGCGTSMNLAEVFYRNRYKPIKYFGLDIRNVDKKGEKLKSLDWCEFKQEDLCSDFNYGNDWDIITSFEVIEHIGKNNIDKFLTNLVLHANINTKIFISTPCFDEKVGAAQNHIFDSGDGNGKISQEFSFNELKEKLEKYFNIKHVFGTFASQKDYKSVMNDWQIKMFNELHEYYDSNLLSNIMAPFFPEYSRNCIWELDIK